MIVYRASEIGGCTKAVVAKRLGYDMMEAPEDFQIRFKEGDLHEEAVISTLLEMGYEVDDRQFECNVAVAEGIVLQGHIDGTVLPPMSLVGGRKILEIKSMSDEEFKKFEAALWEASGLVQRYKWQLSAYMVAMGMEALVVAKNRNNGQLKLVGVELPFYDEERLRSRVLECEDWAARDELPILCDATNYPCPFYYLHASESTELTTPNIQAIKEAAVSFLAAKKNTDLAKEVEKIAREELLRSLDGTDKVKQEGISITYYDYTTTTLNKAKMKEDGVDVGKYEDKTVSKRLRVKLEEGANGIENGE